MSTCACADYGSRRLEWDARRVRVDDGLVGREEGEGTGSHGWRCNSCTRFTASSLDTAVCTYSVRMAHRCEWAHMVEVAFTNVSVSLQPLRPLSAATASHID